MKRRAFLALISGLAAASPVAARAQNLQRKRQIGVLIAFAEPDPEGQVRVAAFLETFREFGWIDGDNSRVVVRWSGGDLERMQLYAKELVGLTPDVVVVGSTPALMAVQRETGTVPIVFVQVSDPVGSGFAASLSRPGGNMTGFANFEESMGSKWLELLNQVAPGVKHVAVLIHAETTSQLAFWNAVQNAAPSFGVQLTAAEVYNPSEVEHAIASFASQGNGGLIVLPDPIFNTVREVILASTARYRLPTIYPFRFYTLAGGLLSYGIDQIEQWRGAARYADRILRGAKPADLPVQQPTKFELVVNLRTAQTLGLTVPQSLLIRADEVIE
jgi:putative ABC transport system substrate-binding protein